MKDMPLIDEEKCEGCGLCVSVCQCGVLAMEDNKVKIVELENCGWCTLCEMVCPYAAISCPFEIIMENSQT